MLKAYKLTITGLLEFDPDRERPETVRCIETGAVPFEVAIDWISEAHTIQANLEVA